jgi:hypothetical protein
MEKLDGIDMKKVFEDYQKTHDLSNFKHVFGQK